MQDQSRKRPRVVVLGAGFAGLTATMRLAREPVNVTVIDRHNYHLFQPLLYQVATAALSPAGDWLDVETDRSGRIEVDAHLRLPGDERIFVLGDVQEPAPESDASAENRPSTQHARHGDTVQQSD